MSQQSKSLFLKTLALISFIAIASGMIIHVASQERHQNGFLLAHTINQGLMNSTKLV